MGDWEANVIPVKYVNTKPVRRRSGEPLQGHHSPQKGRRVEVTHPSPRFINQEKRAKRNKKAIKMKLSSRYVRARGANAEAQDM